MGSGWNQRRRNMEMSGALPAARRSTAINRDRHPDAITGAPATSPSPVDFDQSGFEICRSASIQIKLRWKYEDPEPGSEFEKIGRVVSEMLRIQLPIC